MRSRPTNLSENDNRLIDIKRLKSGLQIFWADGFQSYFHFIWLRGCCYCDSCGDVYSSRRFLLSSNISLDVFSETMKIYNDELRFEWSGDQHVSREDFHQRMRLLAGRLDLQAEADMVLLYGVAV